MITLTPSVVAVIMASGAVAGCLGALLGLGGGVFLVPFLNAWLGLDFKTAAAISLVTVIATSSAVSAGTDGRNLINLRLGMLLEVASAAGGVAAGITVAHISDITLERGFAVITALIAVLMLTRLEQRNVIVDATDDPGPLGGRFYDDESGGEVVYRVRRLPVALGVSFLAGNVSAAFGIGGGILKVPVLTAWCGVPMRVAAATSSLMIGVTAVASVPIQYAQRLRQSAAGRGGRAGRADRFARRAVVRRPRAREMAEAADGDGADRWSASSIFGGACDDRPEACSEPARTPSRPAARSPVSSSAPVCWPSASGSGCRTRRVRRHVAAERRADGADGDADHARGRFVRRVRRHAPVVFRRRNGRGAGGTDGDGLCVALSRR